MSSPVTFGLIDVHLPACLSAIVRGYFRAGEPTTLGMARAGEYEACMCHPDTWAVFLGACQGGHLAIVELVVGRGGNDLNTGLALACRNGHFDVAKAVVAAGAVNYSWALGEACFGGHDAIAEFLIGRGACNVDRGLAEAFRGGRMSTIELMAGHGASDWDTGMMQASASGRRQQKSAAALLARWPATLQ